MKIELKNYLLSDSMWTVDKNTNYDIKMTEFRKLMQSYCHIEMCA